MFCKIIGFPLTKPISVRLWRSFFKKKKLKISMNALEIYPNNFNKKFNILLKKRNFLASAITMPYKKKIFNKVKIQDDISKYSKSVNLIIKKKDNIFGFNTDVYGALKTLSKFKIKKKIMIYGFGGSGEAICRVIQKKYKKSKIIVISNKKKPKDLKKKIVFISRSKFKNLKDIDLFINCSPLGSDLSLKFISQSPINDTILQKRKKNFGIFDIVYSPKSTILGKLAKKNKINYFNGIEMNTFQASKSLKLVYKFYKINNEKK